MTWSTLPCCFITRFYECHRPPPFCPCDLSSFARGKTQPYAARYPTHHPSTNPHQQIPVSHLLNEDNWLIGWLRTFFRQHCRRQSEDSSKKRGVGLVQFPKKIYNCDWKSHKRVIHPKIWSSAIMITMKSPIGHGIWKAWNHQTSNQEIWQMMCRKSLPRYPDQKLIREIMKHNKVHCLQPSHWWIGRISLAEALGSYD